MPGDVADEQSQKFRFGQDNLHSKSQSTPPLFMLQELVLTLDKNTHERPEQGGFLTGWLTNLTNKPYPIAHERNFRDSFQA